MKTLRTIILCGILPAGLSVAAFAVLKFYLTAEALLIAAGR